MYRPSVHIAMVITYRGMGRLSVHIAMVITYRGMGRLSVRIAMVIIYYLFVIGAWVDYQFV